MLKCKIQNLSKETENVKKGQMENLELKNTNNKRKNSVDELNSVMDGDTEEKSMKFQIAWETVQTLLKRLCYKFCQLAGWFYDSKKLILFRSLAP